MTKENGYGDWTDHPRWDELQNISNEISRLKEESLFLRELIQDEVYGVEDESPN